MRQLCTRCSRLSCEARGGTAQRTAVSICSAAATLAVACVAAACKMQSNICIRSAQLTVWPRALLVWGVVSSCNNSGSGNGCCMHPLTARGIWQRVYHLNDATTGTTMAATAAHSRMSAWYEGSILPCPAQALRYWRAMSEDSQLCMPLSSCAGWLKGCKSEPGEQLI